ncbi:hypothetical protein PoB_003636300 [Plakobranchus ocellatus]|uniref:Uncharacterized protein n=1 Tax=Plakobranchus ocellatus TaxID=259542 RepID=A0AAV4ASR8_9GAST|nr:hypothetical protein PoB_003636300 [Plakobranchus ocellatus]
MFRPSSLCQLCGPKRQTDNSVFIVKRTVKTRQVTNISVVESLPSQNLTNPHALLRVQNHCARPTGQRMASGQSVHVKKGLSRSTRVLLALTGALSAGYLAVRCTVNLDEPAKPYQASSFC